MVTPLYRSKLTIASVRSTTLCVDGGRDNDNFFSFVTIADVIVITFLFNFTFLTIPVFYGLIENLNFIRALTTETERTTRTHFPQI